VRRIHVLACNRHITQERLPTSRYVFVLRAEIAGDTSLLFLFSTDRMYRMYLGTTSSTFFRSIFARRPPGAPGLDRRTECDALIPWSTLLGSSPVVPLRHTVARGHSVAPIAAD
jgi:hypothetical protein